MKHGSKRTFDIFAFGKDTIVLAKVSDHAYYWSYNIKNNACVHCFILCAASEKYGFKYSMPSHDIPIARSREHLERNRAHNNQYDISSARLTSGGH